MFYPQAMKAERRWNVRRAGEKKPVSITTGTSKGWPTLRYTASFEEALAHWRGHPNRDEGLAFVVAPGDAHTGGLIWLCLDFDRAFDPADRPWPWIQAIIDRASTYTELSRSGNGLHVFLQVQSAPLSGMGQERVVVDDFDQGGIEVIFNGQIATTGNVYGEPREVAIVDAAFLDTLPFYVARNKRDTAKARPEFGPFDQVNYDRCREHVMNMPDSVAKEGGDDMLFSVGCAIAKYGISGEPALAIMHDYNDTKAFPAWDEGRLTYKIQQSADVVAADGEIGIWTGNEFSELPVDATTADDDFELINAVPDVPADEDPGPLPGHLTGCPGFLNQVVQSIMETAEYPCPHASYAAASHLQSICVARKVTDENGTALNRATVTLKITGSGKNHPRNYLSAAIDLCGFPERMGSRFASQQGIEDRLAKHPVVCYQTDEAHSLCKRMANAKEAWDVGLHGYWLELLTAGVTGGFIYLRDKANNKLVGRKIPMPFASIHATATPTAYYAALSTDMAEEGYLGRTIHYEAFPRKRNKAKKPFEIPEDVLEFAKWLLGKLEQWNGVEIKPVYPKGATKQQIEEIDAEWFATLPDPTPKPQVWLRTPEAKALNDTMRDDFDAKYTEAESAGDLAACATWGRASEQANMFALDRAISRLFNIYTSDAHCFEENKILADDVRWGYEKAKHLAAQKLWRLKHRTPDTRFAKQTKTVVAQLKSGRKSTSDLLRNTGLTKKELQEVIDMLLEDKLVKGSKHTQKSDKCNREYVTKYYELTPKGTAAYCS